MIYFMQSLSIFSNLPFSKNKAVHKSGFTLIELMVVVAIMGILMAAGILAFSNAQQGARDSKRRTDLDAISKAMEQYFQTNNAYPTSAYATALGAFFPSNSLPVDTKGVAYTLTSTATTYCACAQLDKVGLGNASSLGAGGSCAYAAGGNYQCVSQRQ